VLCGLGLTCAGGQPSTKKAAQSSTAKKPAAKTSSKSKKGKSSKQSARNRRSAPRQSAPTAERYREIQQALTDKGFGAGPADGVWGTEWVDALKRFQTNQNLNSDGKLGSLSLIALGLGPKREPMAELAGKPEPIE
jgi:peptidoglycan hydrolase-like protein with peptidoglycan-binding domain